MVNKLRWILTVLLLIAFFAQQLQIHSLRQKNAEWERDFNAMEGEATKAQALVRESQEVAMHAQEQFRQLLAIKAQWAK